jgi:hypothetical protein
MHGGASTGPRTPEGRKRLSELALARYFAAALADGWSFASPEVTDAVVALMGSLGGSQNGTAKALGVRWHAVRRVLSGLPVPPEELWQMRRLIDVAE